MNNINQNVCDKHKNMQKETPRSPGRGMCHLCKKKNVAGYTNANHITNPFGYLYLIPYICYECSIKKNKCMWCVM
tara:strand:+ start:815 stop:1039 length:225 start_codon:yes stop_codon:yes gene_type:complete